MIVREQLYSGAAMELSMQMDREIQQACGRANKGRLLNWDEINRRGSIEIREGGWTVFLLDNKPLLEMGPVKIGRSVEHDAFITTFRREYRRVVE